MINSPDKPRETIKKLSTNELRALSAEAGLHIVDVRPVDAYNGWCLQGEKRGGHIPGARSLPYKWAKYIDWIEIVRTKGIGPKDKIIVYGYDEDAREVAALFSRTGHQDVAFYPDYIEEWVEDETLPLESLPRYSQLVHPAWVKDVVNGDEQKEHPGNNTVICHAHYRNPDDYSRGHIPGAIALDTLQLESPETWNRRSPEEVKETLLSLGINSDTTVVLYGRFSFPRNEDPFPGSSAGHLGAIRCAFIMLWAGVKDVRVLNGGLQSWKDEGYLISTAPKLPDPLDEFGVEIPAHPELAVDTPEAKEMIKDPQSDIVCVRSWPEYIGEVSGYNYIEKTGRIPGAVWSNCGSDAYHMENFRNLDHTVREASEVVAEWKRVGLGPEKRLAFYCGTGWRGSEAFLNAWLMAWPNIAVYDGGWFEWSNDPENPVDSGIPTGVEA